MTPAPAGRTVQFEGKTHQFPSDATDDEIRSALDSSSPAPNPQLAQNQQIINKRDAAVTPQGSALSRFGGGLLNGAKGLVMGAVPGLPEMVNGAKGFAAGGIPGVEKAVHDASPAVQAVRGIRAMGPVGMKDVPEIAGRALSAIVPGGPQAAQAGEQIGSGDVAGGMGTAAGAVLPLVGGEVPVSRLRSPVTFGEPRLPSLSEIGQKAGIPIRSGPATAIPYAAARAASGIKLRSPIGPAPVPAENYAAPYLDPQGPADLRTPSENYEPPYLPVKGPEPPTPVSRNPSWRGLAPQAEAAPTSAPIPATAMPSGRVPGNGIPKPAPPAENFQAPYLSPHGPPAEDFVPPYLDPQGPFSEAHAKGISAPSNPGEKPEVGAASKGLNASSPKSVPSVPSVPTSKSAGAKGLNSGDIAQQLKAEMESSGSLPKGKGITPPPADAQPAIVTGQRLARGATSAGIAGDLKAQGITPDKLPSSDDIGGWQKLFEQNGSPFRKTPEAQRKMIDAVQKEFEKQ